MQPTYEQLAQENNELRARLEQAEAALHRSEDRFNQIIQNIAGIFWIGKPLPEHGHDYVSPKFEQVFGIPYHAVIDEKGSVLSAVHPDDQARYLDSQKDLFERGRRDLEYRIVRPNGEIRHLRSRAFVIYGTDGSVQPAGITEDITEQKEIELAMRTSEERYRSVVNAITNGIVFHNRNGEILTCNRAAERILGLTIDQMTGRTPIDPRWQSIHEDGSPFPGDTHPASITLKTGQPVSNVIMGVHKSDGSLSWLLVNSQPIFTLDDPQPKYVVASFTDITHNREMEQALRESHQRLELSIRSAQLGTWDWNIVTGDFSYNDQWVTMLGYDKNEMEPNIKAWESLIHPDDYDRIMKILNAHVDGFNPVYQAEHRLRKKNGDWLWVLTSGQVLERGPDNQPLRAAGIHLDISQRRQAEEQAIKLEIERRRVQVLSDFIRDTSHDLKTPISLLGTGLYLLRKISDPEQRAAKIKDLEKHLRYLIDVIEQMQKMAVLDSIVQFDLKVLSLSMILDELATNTRQRAKQKAITFEYENQHHLPKVAMNVDHLFHALTNLIDNALQFTSEGGTISLCAYGNNDEVIVEINDNGIGIETAAINRIFERFYKGDTARVYGAGGAGLGLPIAKRIIELHHGHIDVESTPNEKTTFRVVLPAVQPKI